MRADIDRVHTDRRRVLGVAMDVTEHHRALDALREASQRAALITRHAGIGTWETDTRRQLRELGCADVPAARPRPCRSAAEARGAGGAGPSRRSAASSRLARGDAGDASVLGLRVQGPPARRQLPLARLALGGGARRRRRAGAPGRRQLGRHRKQERGVGAPAGGARRARDPGQVAVPLAHEPRAAHAAQRRARLHPAAADRGAQGPSSRPARQARPHPRRRRSPALAHQRRARSLRPGVGRGQAVAAGGRSRRAGAPVAAAAAVARRAARRRRRRRPQRRPRVRRSDAPAPGADQPDLERDQVQPARRQGRGRDRRRRRRRDADGARHRPRSERRADRGTVRALQPLRRRERGHRGNRHRPDDRQVAGRRHEGAHRRRQRARPGHAVQRHAAGGEHRTSTERARSGSRAVAGADAQRRPRRDGAAPSSTSRTTRSTCCSSRSSCEASAD